MKLTKHLTIALALCALPATAFGQTVSCEVCTHDVSVYMGDGGLIAEADGEEMVSYASTCGNVLQHGKLEPNDDGMVLMQFKDMGLVCNEEDGHLQIGPVKDGGWFWLTDEMNSAVGSLVNHDILKNDKTTITSAGDGVTMTMGRGAVLVKETATGRLGVLSNILPDPPMPELRKCGYDDNGAAAGDGRYTRVATNCAMGTGRALVLMTITDPYTGKTVQIPPGGTVTRPLGDGTLTMIAAMYMDGTGHFTKASDGNPRLAHPEAGLADRPSPSAHRIHDASYPVAWASITTGGGVTSTYSNSVATITIRKSDAHCKSPNNKPFKVNVLGDMDPDHSGPARSVVTPAIPMLDTDTGRTVAAHFTVVCP